MTLEFRTKRDNNGNCKYLGIDTAAKTFTRVWAQNQFYKMAGAVAMNVFMDI